MQIRIGNGSEGGERDFFVTLPLARMHLCIHGVVIWTGNVNLYAFDETVEQFQYFLRCNVRRAVV